MKFSRALRTYRNTQDRDTWMSMFDRQLRGFLPTAPLVSPMWKEIADAREKAFATRSTSQHEKWSMGVRELEKLNVGDHEPEVLEKIQTVPEQAIHCPPSAEQCC